jgi:murein DD-endopeptidase MepM/ murein hydrolase activator NlpD
MPQHRVARFGRVGGVMRVRIFVIMAAVALTITATQPIAASDGPPQFSLPWSTGQIWRLTGGPHSNVGYGRPWSSLDFAGPVPGVSYPVRAAAAGVVVRPCANWVQIKHGNGWETSYYHLIRIKVTGGQTVQRGQLLGYTSTQAGCGGSATGPHVHFSLKHDGQYVNIRGFTFGGWTVREGSAQYLGCLVRAAEKRCFPSGRVYNFGS